MMTAKSKNVLLGVSGGIAAYKSAEIVRRLSERGHVVRVVMSAGAQHFITPLTLQALSGNPVHTDLLDERAEAAMGHIELARWADIILIAPATANVIAKLAAGLADELLTTVCLASSASLLIAPAMNQQMWRAAATQHNVRTLQQRGISILGPDAGAQACGDIGPGRLLDPNLIVAGVCERLQSTDGEAAVLAATAQSTRLNGVRVMVTAGPTREPIDPVRYISNHSSGKMGYAVAEAAQAAGASVTLVTGPTALAPPSVSRVVKIETCEDLYRTVMAALDEVDLFIAAAAVADYRPACAAQQKIKKDSADMTLKLVPTPDVLALVSAHQRRPFCVGFAAETDALEKHARSKLERKHLDMIAANLVGLEDSGFASDFNALELYWQGGGASLQRAPKRELAMRLVEVIAERYRAKD